MSENSDIDFIELEKTLNQIKAFKLSKNKDTYFDVIGYGHYENINSNILAYYFSSENFYTYFIEALFELLDIKGVNSTCPKTIREYPTEKGGRLDILIETDEFIIGIENKIYHYLNNDLDDYRETIKKIDKDKKVILCLLTVTKTKPQDTETKNILHIDLWNKIFEKIDFSQFQSSDKHIILLNEVKENIEYITKGLPMEKEQIKFLQNNNDEIKKLLKLKDNFEKEQTSKCVELQGEINEYFKDKPIFKRTGIARVDMGYCVRDSIVFLEFYINNITIAIDIVLDISQKWQIYILDRNGGKLTEKLKEILSNNIDFEEKKYDNRNRAKLAENIENVKEIRPLLEELFKKLGLSKLNNC